MEYVVVFVAGFVSFPVLWAILRKKHTVPNVLGSSVPLQPHRIDFSRPYRITTGERWGGGGIHEFEGCRITGYVEKDKGTTDGNKFAEDWIVAELPDHRKLFLTPQSIRFMEEMASDHA